nr:hypothetical protein [Gammaproteobacteria bacterium]
MKRWIGGYLTVSGSTKRCSWRRRNSPHSVRQRGDAQRRVLTIEGDAGLLMNAQEQKIATAVRCGLAFVILIWTDG